MLELRASRKNGFQYPFHWRQYVSWVAFVAIVILGIISIGQVLNTPLNWIFYAFLTASGLASILSTLITTGINPQYEYNKDAPQEKSYCHVCSKTKPPDTLHCRICGKCIKRFDHHCFWLNNCIGARNYKWFMSTLITVATLCTGLFICSIVFLVFSFTRRSLVESLLTSCSLFQLSLLSLQILLVIYALLLAVVMYYVYELLFLHIKLSFIKETTYSYLTGRESKKMAEMRENRKQKAQQETQQRSHAAIGQSSSSTTNRIPMEAMDHAISTSPVGDKPQVEIEMTSVDSTMFLHPGSLTTDHSTTSESSNSTDNGTHDDAHSGGVDTSQG